MKGKISVNEMKVSQCLDWLSEILDNAALGTTDEIAKPEVFNKLKDILLKQDVKLKRQDEVIDYLLDKVTKKDIVIITKRLIQ